MSRYPWKWSAGHRWPWWWLGLETTASIAPRVPPDTARRRLRRRQMETLAALVLTAKRMGKEVRS